MENTTQQSYHFHITTKHSWYDLKLKEVWKYRDLIALFTKRNFTLTYKQTVLGPAWIFITPLLTSLMHAFVFGNIAGIGTEGVPHILFYMCSNAIWTYFAGCVTKNASTFTANAGVFGKVYFPRLTIPVSNVLSAIIQFGVQMIMVLALLAYYLIRGEVTPHWEAWLLIPVLLLHLGLLGLGFGIIISSMTTKYRDLTILVGFGMQLWMYGTPVVYPLSMLPEGGLRNILLINPVTAPVELFRYALLGQGQILPGHLALSGCITVAVVILGILVFNRVEKTFMDTV